MNCCSNWYKSELITGFEMTVAERDELIAFLMTLNDESMSTIERLQTPFCQRRAGEVINAPCEEPFVVE